MKIYCIGLNNSLVSIKHLAICLLEMALEHNSVAYLQVISAHFQM